MRESCAPTAPSRRFFGRSGENLLAAVGGAGIHIALPARGVSDMHDSCPADTSLSWLARVALIGTLVLCWSSTRAHALEVSGGASSLIVLGPLSGQTSMALDASLTGPIANAYAWSAGARLGIGAWSSEVFGRVTAGLELGPLLPTAGIELGVSARSDDDSGEKLLAEGRASSRQDLFPGYIALHTAPLRFRLFDNLRVSVLELQLGTHFVPLGRFVRLNVQLISLAVVL